MSEQGLKTGSKEAFQSNWTTRSESYYNHWTPGRAKNQIQLAFKCHWAVFSQIMQRPEPGESLEVGAGRGSLSCHFAQNGWKTTLLDYSPDVIEIAKTIFRRNKLVANFDVGDANALPYPNDTFDCVSSIGLLEHFEEPHKAIQEQWRVLKSGGWLIAYIVPEKPDNVQRHFNWVNRLLAVLMRAFVGKKSIRAKEEVYRNDHGSEFYLPIFDALEPKEVVVSGIYSLPMISHSPEFPFSLLPGFLERILVVIFSASLKVRAVLFRRHGWLCEEKTGQALLIAAKKP